LLLGDDHSSLEASPELAGSAYTALCTYLVQPGKEELFGELLRRHWPTLRKYRLVTEDAALIYFGRDYSGPFFVEILTWVDLLAPGRAYWTPEINDIWTELYALTESRDGRPGIDYPSVRRHPCGGTGNDQPTQVADGMQELPVGILDWNEWYLNGKYLSSWDLDAGSPELAFYLASHPGRSTRTALDLGCGSGSDCVLLARAGYSAAGVDISPEALRLAAERAVAEAVEVSLREGSVLALPWEAESFDLVADRGCFHHIPEESRLLYAREVARVLKQGGALLLRGSRIQHAAFIPVTESSLAHFRAAGLQTGELQEIELSTAAGSVPGYLCVIQKKG
jgi:2-polyprenyl-3-methyl-5-hydroxy-6-metoxy-1,4-benzoquinol methylase